MAKEKSTKHVQPQNPRDLFIEGGDEKKPSERTRVLKNGLIFDAKQYEYKDDFVPADTKNALEVHTTHEMIEHLKQNKNAQLEARVLGMNGDSRAMVKMNREQFLAAAARRDSKRLRESVDSFAYDDGPIGAGGPLIGHDFTPLLGGPFNKQLYYRDYLRMIASCFFAYHHDPIARDIVSIIVDFTMGRGFTLHTDNKAAQALWNAFAEANDFHRQMDYFSTELSIYGEGMWWWLPNNQTRISFNPGQGEKIPKGLIPRIRLIDPSNIAEIITVPEDIWQPLYYVWLAPTQTQMYTRDNQPSSKFIYTQIPAGQIIHEKINSVSNEKRGRSDYFPALGYMKRLRDGVNYALVGQQKAAAWCIDTTIKGNDADIQQYVSDQQGLGQLPAAGSEFVHTEAITRTYLSNSATSKGGESPVFSWCLNMICMAAGVPMSYLGTHLSGGTNRASALVSTEPVAKRFERRRLVYDRTVKRIFKELMEKFGIEADCEIMFPELITQDRSAKLNDLLKAQNASWISHRRASETAAKELDIKDFNYKAEQAEVLADDKALGISPGMMNPLTAPGSDGQTGSTKQSALTSPEKNDIKKNLGTL
jgi:hypothetical protein